MEECFAEQLQKAMRNFDPELVQEFIAHGQVIQLPAGEEILREGQFVKVVPLVLEGLIKVYSRYEDRELLLYYIQPTESCVMSFSASLENAPSEVFAITEEATTVVLLSSDRLREWVRRYPDLNRLFFALFNTRYSELLDTINHLLYQKMDLRLLDFLTERSKVTGQRALKLSHRAIANELGTAREVVSRVLKKLEAEARIKQTDDGIELL